MKNSQKFITAIIAVIAVMLFVPAVSLAQLPFAQSLENNKTYANSQNDTAVYSANASFSGYLTGVFISDTVNVKIYIETRVRNLTAWTLKDSVSYSGNGSQTLEWTIRDAVTNRIPGLMIDIRSRFVFAGSGNAVGGKKYTYRAHWRY